VHIFDAHAGMIRTGEAPPDESAEKLKKLKL
jgi:hypothetical protein